MGREKLQNPAILGEILGENHALKIDPQEENKKRTAWGGEVVSRLDRAKTTKIFL